MLFYFERITENFIELPFTFYINLFMLLYHIYHFTEKDEYPHDSVG